MKFPVMKKDDKKDKDSIPGPVSSRGLLHGLTGRKKHDQQNIMDFRRVSAYGKELTGGKKSSLKRSTTMLQRLVQDMRTCLNELSATDFTNMDLENMAVLIFESMSSSSRVFHSVQHVFDVSEGLEIDEKPIPILAAFFHDIVYYGIDGGLTEDQAQVLKGIILEEDGEVKLREKFVVPKMKKKPQAKDDASEEQDQQEEEDKLIAAVTSIFNFEPGQVLNPFQGLNEFLSAALAVRCLRNFLPLKHLAAIACCIEATIPFRKPDSDGNTASDLLYTHLKQTNETFAMEMTEEEIVVAVQDATDLANRDLRNFTTPSQATFLSNTWNLLHESNIDLRHTTVYRISSFAVALKKMSGFFLHLDPNSLYNSFHGVPSTEDIEEFKMAAQKNIDVAGRYLQAKLLSICVLAAFAELTGGDAPIALFLGDLPTKDSPSSPGIEDYIKPTKRDTNIKVNQTVYEVLKNGREGGDTHFDLQNSPLAAYLYGVLGEAGLDECLKYAVCPMDKENAKKLLDSLPREVVAYIAKPCAMLAESRKDGLNDIVKEYMG